ncbi:hypothetical protein [Nostoc sp. PCC 7107]|uniref:hypothetical protein n=1 Tax=Nostoc sp. PCC 7107 TaxID=317936 RepID=UPI00029EC572|nr:hypothetical protein [Nostoc sp. PCC 7107]AFY43423.1 hypothetical protein Nos7107_2826 [Nostoc sp. PCC 7107]
MNGQTIYQNLSNLDLLIGILTIFSSIAVGSFTTYKFLDIIFKRERILFKNLERKIKIFDPPNKCNRDMSAEFAEIQKNPLFKKVEPILIPNTNIMQISNINHGSLIILGVGNDFNYFEAVFNEAKRQRSPIIIYTYGDSQVLQKNHWDLLNTYRWYSVSTSPLRLISDIFAILSTFIYEDR